MTDVCLEPTDTIIEFREVLNQLLSQLLQHPPLLASQTSPTTSVREADLQPYIQELASTSAEATIQSLKERLSNQERELLAPSPEKVTK